MTQVTEQVDHSETGRKNDPAFEIIEVNTKTGETTLVIQKGILGAMGNQLKNTSNQRKGASIIRKMGHVLSACGDIQYGKDVADTDVDSELVVDTDELTELVEPININEE